MSILKEQVGQRLMELRTNSGYSQKYVSGILGITQQGYHRYEAGLTEANYESLCKLADLYNVTTDYLLGREVSNDPPNTEAFIAACRAMSEPEFEAFYKLCMTFAHYREQGLLGSQEVPESERSTNDNTSVKL